MDAFEREADMSKEFRSGLKTKAGLFAGSKDWGEGAPVVVVVGAKKRSDGTCRRRALLLRCSSGFLSFD